MAAKSTKQRKNSKSRPNKKQQDNGLRGEIIILVLLAVCILLVLSNFGLGGIAGEAVSSVFFGLFGFMAYVLPFVIFGLAAFLVSNRGNTHAYIKIAAAVVLFLLLTAILELIFNSYTPAHRSFPIQDGGRTQKCRRTDRRMCGFNSLSADWSGRDIRRADNLFCDLPDPCDREVFARTAREKEPGGI